MNEGVNLLVIPVKDLERAKAVYGALLGKQPYADETYYVGFKVGDQEIGLDPHGHQKGQTGPLPYWEVADIQKAIESLQAAGAQTQQQSTGVGGGKLIATVKDADGNLIGLLQNP
jgi:predicted enzyme related to lactoylglutathione lyase